MAKFAVGKNAYGISDRSGFRYKLNEMKREWNGLLVGKDEWEKKQPQLEPRRTITDPQALRNPRKDTTYVTSGVNVNGNVSGGSRDIQWGWYPVGGASLNDAGLTPNYLVATTFVGTVSIS